MSKEKILARGAEAVIIKKGSNIVKKRIPKSYRLPVLDEKLRKLRTRSEAKIIEKLQKVTNVPKLIKINEKTKELEIQFIAGKKLADHLESLDYQKVCKQMGQGLAKIHDSGIIHGDLTTSNMIYSDNKVYFIDFGLGFHSDKIEDKAVDLHLIKEALEAKHSTIFEKASQSVIEGYKSQSKHAYAVLKQLEKVEKRGRYKAQY